MALSLAQAMAKIAELEAATPSKKVIQLVESNRVAPVVYDEQVHQLIIGQKLQSVLIGEGIEIMVRVSEKKAANGKFYANLADESIDELLAIHYDF